MDNREFVERFELAAYVGHIEFIRSLVHGAPAGAVNNEQIDVFRSAMMQPEEYLADIRECVPLDEWFFAMNEHKPAAKDIQIYNTIIKMTEVGKALGMTEGGTS